MTDLVFGAAALPKRCRDCGDICGLNGVGRCAWCRRMEKMRQLSSEIQGMLALIESHRAEVLRLANLPEPVTFDSLSTPPTAADKGPSQ